MKVSIIVGTRNRPWLCQACLTSLLANDYADREIIVVDQSEDDQTEIVVRQLAQSHEEVHYIRDEGVGSSRARNLGIARSQGDVLAFTDDDCRVAADWLSGLAREFAAGEVAGVLGRILAGQHCRSTVAVAIQEHSLRREHRGEQDVWRLGYGPNMAFRRRAIQAAGGFDERLGPGAKLRGCNDVDLIYRVVRSGGRVIYSPNLVVQHEQWRDWPEALSREKQYALGAGGMIAKYLRVDSQAAIRLLVFRLWPFGAGRSMVEMRTVAGRSAWWAVAGRALFRIYCVAVFLPVGIAMGLGEPVKHTLYSPRNSHGTSG